MKIGKDIRQQDKRPRHGRAAKRLSAHRFVGHGRAGEKCRDTSQNLMDQRTFGCRLRPVAMGCPWGLPRVERVMGGSIAGFIPLY